VLLVELALQSSRTHSRRFPSRLGWLLQMLPQQQQQQQEGCCFVVARAVPAQLRA
jgi:hypothetical protein